jgi:ribosomal protein L11 methyltransferase
MKVKLSQTAPVFQVLSADLVLVALRKPPAAGPGARLLRINPGRAFPPTHPTSRLCLELLQEHLSAGPGAGVLDVGCGAGILGLAAAALGAPLVLCLDIAGQAAQVTLENARENGLAGRLRVVRGSTECVRRTFGLVAANLPWETQMAKAQDLSRLAAPDGALILSGFRDNQEHPLKKLYHQAGWSVAHRRVRDFRHPELPPGLSFTWVAWVLRPHHPGAPA